jgi:hypothetical protein
MNKDIKIAQRCKDTHIKYIVVNIECINGHFDLYNSFKLLNKYNPNAAICVITRQYDSIYYICYVPLDLTIKIHAIEWIDNINKFIKGYIIDGNDRFMENNEFFYGKGPLHNDIDDCIEIANTYILRKIYGNNELNNVMI